MGPLATIKVYDLSQPIPRTPVHTTTFAISATRAQGLPSEVALVLSYRAPLVSGSLPARRRGRVYIGPFGTNALAAASINGDSRPILNLMQNIVNAAARLMQANTADIYWSTYSPTDASALEVTSVHVDNAWDTQRRRGADPTARISLEAGGPV